ncbi:MAG: hypothetical protein KA270_01315 [Saprospiraceae bacterium]|nr:hypothetical protein [Saprospiraceae bacterium]
MLLPLLEKMIDFQQVYDLSDQPTTCPKCGIRTEILLELKLKTKGIQVHRCLGKNCTFEFSSEYYFTKMTRDEFIAFFRDNECLNTLSVDDRIEVFSTILLGSSDFKKSLLDEIFSDYGVEHLEVIDHGN